MKIINALLSVSVYTAMVVNANAQDTMNINCDYAKDPCWINMMKDPNVNYFEAIKAFDEFWKARGGEPFYSENAEERNKYMQKIRTAEEKKAEEEKQKYLMDYKRFLAWKRQVEPYVQSDGSILSPEEQQKIYRNERK